VLSFSPFDLDRAARLTGGDLDALPFGVIVVDRKGSILEYNSYESDMARISRERVLGRNFFHDVAPCTALQEFEGRFEEFLTSSDTSVEPFMFEFPFTRGSQRVSVVFVRISDSSDRATICVLRMGEVEQPVAQRA
jgi:photoactive yellow protein